jgi:hypothetical protein
MASLIVVTVGLVTGVYIIVQFIRFRGSEAWPIAVATVEAVEVQRVQDHNGHHFLPLVSFSFTIENEYYSGEWVGPAFSSEQKTREFMQQNTPMGAKLSVRYKPKQPAVNVLDVDPALWDEEKPITLDI